MNKRIMYVCRHCADVCAEACGYFDHTDLVVAPDGRWLCVNCWEHDPANDGSHKQLPHPPDLLAEVERLRAIVERLPKTADGVVVVPGDKIFDIGPTGYVQGLDVGDYRKRTDSSLPSECYVHTRMCYSTQEAAEADLAAAAESLAAKEDADSK